MVSARLEPAFGTLAGFFPGASLTAVRRNIPGVVAVFVMPPAPQALAAAPRPNAGLWMIDHTRAFSTEQGRPPELRNAPIVVSPQMRAALANVTESRLATLAPYLHIRQIRALVARAQALRTSR